MKKFIGLVRVSTRMQGETRNGLESQRAEIERWAAYNNYELITIMEEVGSGGLPLEERPVMQAALALARKMRAKVVCTKVDRCSRDAGIARELLRIKKSVVTIALGEQADPFIEHIQSGIGEMERRVGSERTKAGMAAAKARGVLMGNRTNLPVAQQLGCATNRQKADEFAAKIRPTIERMVKEGMSFKAIADEFNLNGTKTARGGAWASQTVKNVVARWQ